MHNSSEWSMDASLENSPFQSLIFPPVQIGRLHDTHHHLMGPSSNAVESSCPYSDRN